SINLQGQYLFKNLTKDHGFGTNLIKCVLKDTQGFIWLGTDNGLFRFDGTELVSFFNSLDDSTSLSENYIFALQQDKNGDIWIGTRNGGINVLNTQTLKFHTYTSNPADSSSISRDVSKLIFIDKKENIWIALTHEGMDMFNRETGTFSNFKPTDRYKELDKRLANTIISFADDPGDEDILWLGTLQGIFSFNTKTKKWKHFPVIKELAENPELFGGRENVVRTIIFDTNGFLWFGSWGGGLCKMNPKTGTFKIFKYETLNPVNGFRNNISKLIKKSENELWVIAQHFGVGEFNISTGKFTFFQDHTGQRPIGSPSDAVVDDNGFMYVSTYNAGLFYCNLNAQQFNRVNNPYHLLTIGSSGKHNTILASTYDNPGKLIEIQKKTNYFDEYTYKPVDDRSDNIFNNILNKDGAIWLIEHFNLYYFDRNSTNIQPYKHFNPCAIMANQSHDHSFISSSIDQNNIIWLGSKFNGMFKVNTTNGSCENFYYPATGEHNPFFEGFIFSLFNDSQNRTWYGSANFGYYDPLLDKFIKFIHPENFSNSDIKLQQIYDITETKDGLIWIGTQQSGIAVINPNVQPAKFIRSYTMRNGLQSNKISELQTDGQGNVWVLTQKGASRIFPETGSVENFGEDYGLSGLRGFHLEEDGEMYIVAGKGYYHFYPQNITPYSVDIKPYILNFKIFDKPVDLSSFQPESGLIKLNYDQNFFSIEFGAINYFEQEAIKSEYILDGLDQKWQDAGDRKFVSYTNLNGGDYIFRLKTTGGKELTIPIYIQTPYWKTWWFYVLIILLVSGLALSFHLYRLRLIRKQEELKIAYDKKISQLEIKALRSQMNPHFLFNSLNSIRYYILKEDNENASEYLTKFSRLLRLILSNSRHSQISLKDELHALEIYIDFEQMRFNQKFDYRITVGQNINQEEIKIQPMTIQPFVENAIWHGLMPRKTNGTLLVDISLEGKILKIIIEDNGIGRQKAKELSKSGLEETKSYGLQITEERMNIMENVRGKRSGFKIVDLFDNKHSVGTRVIITFEI
ncbi:MAG: histidine kinase, partial [Bacteroidales bacterium]|nr:histidine kinase [Bacteroidales bacterium]